MIRFTGKSVLITGAARDIGLAAAQEFAREGASVTITDIDADEAEWMAGVGVGLNFGGGARQVAAVEPTPDQTV